MHQEDQQDVNDGESAVQRGTRLLPQEQALDENRSAQEDHLLQNDRINTQPVFTPELSQDEQKSDEKTLSPTVQSPKFTTAAATSAKKKAGLSFARNRYEPCYAKMKDYNRL